MLEEIKRSLLGGNLPPKLDHKPELSIRRGVSSFANSNPEEGTGNPDATSFRPQFYGRGYSVRRR